MAGLLFSIGSGTGGQLISVHPEELTFELELDKPCCCNLKVINNTEHHIAFKVKTTSPRKYFVRPNTSVVQPWDSCTIIVTLQPQKEYPPDMQCRDKFLLQSIRVPPITDIDNLPPETFNKEGDKEIEERKLRVVYRKPSQSLNGNLDHSDNSKATFSTNEGSRETANSTQIEMLHRLKSERDATVLQNQKLQRKLEMLKRRQNQGSVSRFSLTFAAFAGVVGLMVGFILNLALSSPSTA